MLGRYKCILFRYIHTMSLYIHTSCYYDNHLIKRMCQLSLPLNQLYGELGIRLTPLKGIESMSLVARQLNQPYIDLASPVNPIGLFHLFKSLNQPFTRLGIPITLLRVQLALPLNRLHTDCSIPISSLNLFCSLKAFTISYISLGIPIALLRAFSPIKSLNLAHKESYIYVYSKTI